MNFPAFGVHALQVDRYKCRHHESTVDEHSSTQSHHLGQALIEYCSQIMILRTIAAANAYSAVADWLIYLAGCMKHCFLPRVGG